MRRVSALLAGSVLLSVAAFASEQYKIALGELVVASDVKIDINVEARQVQPSASGAGAANKR